MISVRAFVAYCVAKLEEKNRQEAYRVYVTDALKVIAGNTARYAGGDSLAVRYADIWKPQDTRTAEEVAAYVISRAGLVVM